jgi:hypothetical protein
VFELFFFANSQLTTVWKKPFLAWSLSLPIFAWLYFQFLVQKFICYKTVLTTVLIKSYAIWLFKLIYQSALHIWYTSDWYINFADCVLSWHRCGVNQDKLVTSINPDLEFQTTPEMSLICTSSACFSSLSVTFAT